MYPRRRWLEAKAAQAPEEWKQKLGLQDAVTTNGLSSVHMHVLWRFSTWRFSRWAWLGCCSSTLGPQTLLANCARHCTGLGFSV